MIKKNKLVPVWILHIFYLPTLSDIYDIARPLLECMKVDPRTCENEKIIMNRCEYAFTYFLEKKKSCAVIWP